MKTKRHLPRFTAVELIVVVALIAFLFTMLVPGLVRAREMAKRVYCLNSLHQASKIANMYNLDYGQAPYSSTWLVDFSFLNKYIDGQYGIMECPETEDRVTGAADLNGGTSYHYMGSRADWEKNNLASGDGSEYGFDAWNPTIMTLLSTREEKVMYDRSDTVHYGYFNVVFIESGHTVSQPWTSSDDYWFLTDAGTANFDDGDLPSRDRNRNRHRYRHRFRHGEGDGEHNGDENNNDNDDDEVGPDDEGEEADAEEEEEDGDKEPWKARIIHYPPGNPENQQEITVGWAAWPAHQAHGDVLLEVIYK